MQLFYPDLIDKAVAPTYTLVPIPDEPDFCILRFSAGPPYEVCRTGALLPCIVWKAGHCCCGVMFGIYMKARKSMTRSEHGWLVC
jgi:hypothetical protein